MATKDGLSAAQRRALEALARDGSYVMEGSVVGQYRVYDLSQTFISDNCAWTLAGATMASLIRHTWVARTGEKHLWWRITDAGRAALAEATGETGEKGDGR